MSSKTDIHTLCIDQTFIHWLRDAISPLSYFRAIGNEDILTDESMFLRIESSCIYTDSRT